MKTQDRLDLAHWVAANAKGLGAKEVSVDISNSRQVQIEYRDGQLDTVKESTENSLNISLYVDNKYSGHSTNDLRRESLGKFIQDAVDMTRYLGEDEFRGLPDPKYYTGMKNTDLDLFDTGYEKIPADMRVEKANELQTITASKSDKIISSTAGYYDSESESVKVNSNGFEGVRQTTGFSFGVEATVDDSAGGRPSDWSYVTVRHLEDIPSAEEIASEAVNRALDKIGQTKVESGVYDMIVVNRAAGNPLYALYSPLSGRSLQQKRSFLDGMLGEQIGSEKLTIIDDPFIPRALGSRLYDGEGMTTRKRKIFDKGILKEFLIDCYYARKLGVDPTGGSTSNVIVQPGERSLEEMIASVEKGILVNQFIGGNSNSTTGDFSWGLSGMLIENGKLVKPINEMNISGNLKDLWSNLVETGNDLYKFSSIQRPSLHFQDVQFSGV